MQHAGNDMSASNRKSTSPSNLPSDIPEAIDSPILNDTDSAPRSSSDDWELDEMLSEDGLDDDEETGLTHQERSKRKRRKRRNTIMSERIAQDSKELAKEERRLANATFLRDALINAILIGMWYTFSISISVVSPCPIVESKQSTL